jgi:hypothetical protein
MLRDPGVKAACYMRHMGFIWACDVKVSILVEAVRPDVDIDETGLFSDREGECPDFGAELEW